MTVTVARDTLTRRLPRTAGRMSRVTDQSAGERMLLELLEAAHLTRPDNLPRLVADAARHIGADEVAIYVVDYAQVRLVPLVVEGQDREPVAIDSTLAGRAFRTVDIERTEESGRTRLWVPLSDGTDRVGVLGLVLDRDVAGDEVTLARVRGLGSLVAEFLVSRKQLGDAFGAAARRQEMSLAAEIQWHLLPPLTYADHEVVVAGAVEPAYAVGGDAFDFAVDGDCLRFAVFDAMGHGLQASLICVTAVSAYRNTRRSGGGLVAAALAADAAVAVAFGSETFVTAVLAELRTDTGELRVVVAGHPHPLVVRGGRAVKSVGQHNTLPLGLGLVQVTVDEERLEPGDRVLLYTDGVVEARSPEGEFFGVERMVDFVERETGSGLAAPEIMRRVVHAVLRHQNGQLQDDATMLLVEWRGGRERELAP